MAKTSPVLEKDSKTGRFLPENSGFGGRPKGSRNKLNETFLRDLQEAWEEKGPSVIAAAIPRVPAPAGRAGHYHPLATSTSHRHDKGAPG
jgi:hypothetical protein